MREPESLDTFGKRFKPYILWLSSIFFLSPHASPSA